MPLTIRKKFQIVVILCIRVKAAAVAVKELAEIGDLWTKYDVIGIDEGQFFCDVSLLCFICFYSIDCSVL